VTQLGIDKTVYYEERMSVVNSAVSRNLILMMPGGVRSYHHASWKRLPEKSRTRGYKMC
jgi:hypothetical protein